ncbi:SDR family oxidoreductase [Campylobacter sp.]|uniref:SDR family NAD(P)-dependent oxidoreductase n=1 Tax=Campylobacter sp. TaxID=205 RepID=UPI0025B9DB24|nr:SDR family oxidoreductase [Campylobacter sp.]
MEKQNILITGASRGIGKAIADELTSVGFNCITPSSKELNLNDKNSVVRYIAKNSDLDIYGLVNCAGINILASLDEIDDEKFDDMINVNLRSVISLAKFASVSMRRNEGGKIVNISSIWGVRSKARRTLYSITKFGINGITKALARELGEFNILVNSVAPGYVDTDLTRQNVPLAEQVKIKQEIPLGRFAQTSEIAKLVAFLIGKENSYISGQVIVIDGGFLA